MGNNNSTDNCFNEFRDIPQKRKDPTIQVLYEYEKHYLEMIKKYSEEIKFIQNMLSDFRKEKEEFYQKVLPDINKKLSENDGIDKEMKKNWLNRLSTNIERSFKFSETLINDYAVKNLDEFKQAVNEKLNNI